MSFCERPDFFDQKEKSTACPAADKPVAVMLATYNGENYLREFLNSLCMQDYKDFCVYVRDDGSRDSTLDILKKYDSKLDLRLLPQQGGRLGAFQNFFRLLQEAGGSHACYMLADQDDYWYPDKISRAWKTIGDCPEDIILYCTRLEYVDANLNNLGLSKIPRLLGFENAVVENIAAGCTISITRRVKRNIVAPDSRHSIPHDWWLYLYCSGMGKVIYDGRPSLKYRLHSGNTVGATTSRLKEFIRRYRRYRKNKQVFSAMLQQFLLCHGHELPDLRREFLQDIISKSKKFEGRLQLALQPPFSRQRRIDNLILRMICLLGKF